MKHSKLLLGFFLGFCSFALLSASSSPESTNDIPRYHVSFIGAYGYVYDASTGEIIKKPWKEIDKVANIKELLNK